MKVATYTQILKELKKEGAQEDLIKALTKASLPDDGGVRRHEQLDIVLPQNMSFKRAMETLQRLEEDLERPIEMRKTFDAAYYDVLVALDKGISRLFGFGIQSPKIGFFNIQYPQMTSVDVGLDQNGKPIQVHVPEGRISLPGLWSSGDGVGYIETYQSRQKDGTIEVGFFAFVRKKHQAIINMLAELVREFISTESIYRGQIIDVERKFIWLGDFDPATLVLSQEVKRQLEAFVLTPIRKPDDARKVGVHGRRSGLLVGSYGTGKTMTMRSLAIWASSVGWTAVIGKPDDRLSDLLRFAKQYQPALILLEDIDAQVSGGRDGDLNAVLNTVDGVVGIDDSIVTVMTTNNPNNIHQAMLRPGRIHFVIELGVLDGIGLHQLASNTGLQLSDNIQWDELATEFDDMTPAYDQEAFNRVGLFQAAGDRIGEVVSEDEVRSALLSMRAHLELQKAGSDGRKAALLPIDQSLRAAMFETAQEAMAGDGKIIASLQEILDRL